MKTKLHHPTQLNLIRHGEVEERYHNVFGGSRIDMGLSPLGRQHAQAVAAWLAETPLDAIYASPMLRVQQTLAPLAEARGLKPIIIPSLREVDFGDWTGYRWEGVQEHFGVSSFDWLEIIGSVGIPNGETATELADRVEPALLKILQDNPHKRVAVFCHGGIIRVILALMLSQPLKHMAHFNIQYGSISVVEVQPERKHAFEIELLNFCPPFPVVVEAPLVKDD
ncbi:putative phosphoglycerate mutase [Prosthecobacter fusiformis]|uniref:Putative phosphoglycerate mutase n=1 Tax=Prosthecobacter fusiformis TaxID=48464 RepID=A0A4R7S6T7_9BACT|nr:histidine phosphatase family protein [Prosthecobacter fusiformis]TDU73165.1 putative phosphoglycerate mutase [Prosthecobacter fusiformis]